MEEYAIFAASTTVFTEDSRGKHNISNRQDVSIVFPMDKPGSVMFDLNGHRVPVSETERALIDAVMQERQRATDLLDSTERALANIIMRAVAIKKPGAVKTDAKE